MIKYIIYTQNRCGHCESAKMILREAGETFEERKLDTPEKIKRFKDAGHKTVPQIFLHIGGFHELEEFIFEDKKNTIMGVGGILVWTIGFLVLMAIAIVVKEH